MNILPIQIAIIASVFFIIGLCIGIILNSKYGDLNG